MKMRSSPTSVGSPLCPAHLQSLGIGFVSRPSPSVGYPCLQGLPCPPQLQGLRLLLLPAFPVLCLACTLFPVCLPSLPISGH